MENNRKQSAFAPPPESDEVHFYDYLLVVLRRKRAVFAVFGTVFLGVALYTVTARPIYEANATLNVRDGKGNVTLLSELTGNSGTSIAAEIEILKSRTIAREVVEYLHLNRRMDKVSKGLAVKVDELAVEPELIDNGFTVEVTGEKRYRVKSADGEVLGEGREGELFVAHGVTLLLRELRGQSGDSFRLALVSSLRAAEALRGGIRVNEVGNRTGIIRISYSSHDPEVARDIVNALSQTYLLQTVVFKTEEARKTLEFIEGQLDSVRTALEGAEQNVESYKVDSGVVELGADATRIIAKISDIEKERTLLQLRRRQIDSAIAGMQREARAGDYYVPVAVMEDPAVAALMNQLLGLEAKKRELLTEFTDSYPLVEGIALQIVQVRRELTQTLQLSQSELQRQDKSLTALLNGYDTELRRLPQAERELARLSRLSKVNADIYTILLTKREEARIARAATISNVFVIDEAIRPEQPIKPNRQKNLLLGFVVGLMLGVGVAFFLDYLDDTIRDSDTASRLLGWPVLAVIPYIAPRSTASREGKAPLAAQGEETRRTLISHLEPKSAPAEAFRALRTSLHFARVGREKQVLLVTSALPGEGKSTISANIAATIAQTGVKVLLVGCDLRKPTLHLMFDHPRTPGLSEVLIGDAKLAEALHPTRIAHLDCIVAGTTPPNPAELLNSQQMAQVMSEVRGRYDVIILDAPPLLAVTDASVLTAYGDALLVVIAAGYVPIKAARRMRELLLQGEVTVSGLVLNDRSAKGFEYYGYGGDGYGYGDSYSELADNAALPRRLWRRLQRLRGPNRY
ncbi:MAG: hypothetical protein A2091_03835 [Desulfuromonadales bacterium GWD2_61_12]|nr:MAG: hypothetical protein A2005_00875 [Desulfuromonadales bacterium GWC2_61_20]OGR34259.1 MAG: hypothetical protein A2091_03835 [Desulfuromonadales bacterium GWD2_61_12]HAD04949.1 protein tyrosine kinase [Desulfuromonas sp.]HBT84248.1 protein tyrosine kinase [Desulfuromonas sp.]